MTYSDVLRYLDSLANYERTVPYVYQRQFTLTRVRSVLRYLGNPEKRFKSIVVAGTNGKGSTARMLSHILTHAGYRTGLYTSPHVTDIRERIQIDAVVINRRALAQYAARVRTVVDHAADLNTDTTRPTYFEIVTAIAFCYFAEQTVDIAVCEVGLGGRLDATNVLRPLCSVITMIGHDHQALLGDTLEAIAREKAGIIKKRSVVICARQSNGVRDVLARIARRRHCRFIRAERTMSERTLVLTPRATCVTHRTFGRFAIPLVGAHQAMNAVCAVEAAREVRDQLGWPISRTHVRRALRNIPWPGRIELVKHKPPMILDGGHNQEALMALVAYVRSFFRGKKSILIAGFSGDKDIPTLLTVLRELSPHIIVTAAHHERSCPVISLACMARPYFQSVRSARTPAAAYNRACAVAQNMGRDKSIIIVSGSFFLVGDMKRVLARKHTTGTW